MSKVETQFSMIYNAFDGYSPGGFSVDGTAYVLEKNISSKFPDWKERIEKLNQKDITSASNGIVVLQSAKEYELLSVENIKICQQLTNGNYAGVTDERALQSYKDNVRSLIEEKYNDT